MEIAQFLGTIAVFFTAIIFALILGKPCIYLANRFSIIDTPGSSSHKRHKRPTSIAGGLVLVISLIFLFILFDNLFTSEIWGIFWAGLVIFLFGLWDDYKGLNAFAKLSGQFIALSLLIYSGISVSILRFPGTRIDEVLNLAITFLWVIGITNAFNLIDGGDGIVISITLVASLLLLIGSLIASQSQLIYLSTVLIGICLPLMFFNLPPAQLFMGDSGAQTIGFFLAALGILYSPTDLPQASSWFVPITFLAFPIFDVCLVFFSRIKRRQPFYKSDMQHTFHRLRAQGLSHAKVVWLLALVSILVGIAGLTALYQPPLIANSIFVGILVSGLIAFFILEGFFIDQA